ncbi:phosphoribosylglycinamide formyltransferase [Halopseudomonas phragmitis]|uniref:Phosphoribosylglycinamide formyltransferase n=2 Tax=Pseudomonadaceae TaxID=135621 RepID=A0A1V0B5H4_9GAMM|nr:MULTISPECIES: phosphoribosylglycinamide formyltransferase [Pseudomonadaceae]AQZ95044.1 phosphoribosylglycinamide formyltransferase [Halopseudomonas phragmitis]RHW21838.1 phosphoribosylglycinamide formyltransferase [Pseudomonas jilinensis]
MGCRIVVLISGSGSNLQALIDDLRTNPADGAIVGVVSNRAEAYGLERARTAGIAALSLSHRDYPDRDSFDQALIRQIDALNPDLILLAGFMRILTPDFVNHYAGRLLNIHPSLLPKYKGLHTHQRALEAGDDEHGATIHFVTEELDGGPLVVQGRIPVETGDTPESLAERVHRLEHRLYPLAMRWFIEGRLRLIDGRACLDGEPIAAAGLRLEDFEFSQRESDNA